MRVFRRAIAKLMVIQPARVFEPRADSWINFSLPVSVGSDMTASSSSLPLRIRIARRRPNHALRRRAARRIASLKHTAATVAIALAMVAAMIGISLVGEILDHLFHYRPAPWISGFLAGAGCVCVCWAVSAAVTTSDGSLRWRRGARGTLHREGDASSALTGASSSTEESAARERGRAISIAQRSVRRVASRSRRNGSPTSGI